MEQLKNITTMLQTCIATSTELEQVLRTGLYNVLV